MRKIDWVPFYQTDKNTEYAELKVQEKFVELANKYDENGDGELNKEEFI